MLLITGLFGMVSSNVQLKRKGPALYNGLKRQATEPLYKWEEYCKIVNNCDTIKQLVDQLKDKSDNDLQVMLLMSGIKLDSKIYSFIESRDDMLLYIVATWTIETALAYFKKTKLCENVYQLVIQTFRLPFTDIHTLVRGAFGDDGMLWEILNDNHLSYLNTQEQRAIYAELVIQDDDIDDAAILDTMIE